MKRKEFASWARRSAAKVTDRSPTVMVCDGCRRRFPLADLRPNPDFTGLYCGGCHSIREQATRPAVEGGETS